MTASEKSWLKAELHSHCSLDPSDYKIVSQTPEELIDEAARLGYDVLAITCHDLDVWSPALSEHAARLGVVLVPGMEVSTEGLRHTLVYNFHAPAEQLNTLEKIRALKRPDTLVIAPHPYFPGDICLGELLVRHIDVFDAIETSGFYAALIDFNRRARAVARDHKKPMVGNGDVHLLWQLGRTFTWIYAAPTIEGVLSAIRLGQVRVETRPYPYRDLLRFLATTMYRDAVPLRGAPSSSPPALPDADRGAPAI